MSLPATPETLQRLYHLRDLLREAEGWREWVPLPHQVPPPGDWWGWILQAGRGSGKTDAASAWVKDHVDGPPCISGPIPHRIALVAPTVGDAAQTAWHHPSSYRVHSPDGKLTTRPGGTMFVWPNGAEAKLFGLHTKEDVERLRAGGNNCRVHLEEFAAWRYLKEGWEQIRLGLRIGPHPAWIISTTPKPLKLLTEIKSRPDVVLTRASTTDNPYLNETFKQNLIDDYAGTRLGRQELEGEQLEDIEGAQWTLAAIDRNRWRSEWGTLPTMRRVIVGVDPSGGVAEIGIVTCGLIVPPCLCGVRPDQPHYVCLSDDSLVGTPEQWGTAVVQAGRRWDADLITAEANYGGAMVESTIKAGGTDDRLPYQAVSASRGKEIRAEPISRIYEQGRVHHLRPMPQLEDELTTWTPGQDSPNRLDALVWAMTKLAERAEGRGKAGRSTYAGRLPEGVA